MTKPWQLLVVLGAVVFAYQQVVSFDLIPTWDDAGYALNRPEVKEWWAASWTDRLTTPTIGYAIPLPTAIYAALRAFFGEAYPAAAHGFNLLIHTVNTVLAWLLLRRIASSDTWAALGAGVWALHPACVESVAWVTNLKTLVHLTGILVAMLVWQRYLERRLSFAGAICGVLLGFLVGVGSKPGAIILPALLAIQWWMHPARPGTPRREFALLGAFAMLSALVLTWTFAQHDTVILTSTHATTTGFGRIAAILISLDLAATNTIVPLNLHPAYGMPANPVFQDIITGLAVLLGILGATWLLARRKDRIALGALAMAAVAYAPYAQLTVLPRFFADTYLYLPILALVGLALHLGKDYPHASIRQIGMVVIISLLSFLTMIQVLRWKDGESLWSPVIEANPMSAQAYRQVAFAKYKARDVQGAADVLRSGHAAMRAHHDIPFWSPLIFESVGEPATAVEWAADAVLMNAKPDARNYGILLQVMMRNAPVESSEASRALDIALKARSNGEIPAGLDVPDDQLSEWLKKNHR